MLVDLIKIFIVATAIALLREIISMIVWTLFYHKKRIGETETAVEGDIFISEER